MMFTAFVAKPHVELLFAWLLTLQLDIVRVRLLSGEVLVTKCPIGSFTGLRCASVSYRLHLYKSVFDSHFLLCIVFYA